MGKVVSASGYAHNSADLTKSRNGGGTMHFIFEVHVKSGYKDEFIEVVVIGEFEEPKWQVLPE